MLLACAGSGLSALALELADSTWVPLSPLPEKVRAPLFALAVSPGNNQVVIAGTAQGSLFRTTDGGAMWTSTHGGSAALLTVSFSPFRAGLALAGTRGAGALVTSDGGATWNVASGMEGRQVRVFGFARTIIAAGTDRGVFLSQDGRSWSQGGLADISIGALAVAAVYPPARFIAAGDSAAAGGFLPLFQSADAGLTWTRTQAPLGSSVIVSKLLAGPLPPTGDMRPLLIGTNSALYSSADNGATFVPLTGGSLLPSTDYTQAAFVTDHFNKYYVASDGGGSQSGGLWTTGDAGQHFTSLAPPVPSVTAMAVSNDEGPILYVATFRPADHAATIWAYHDTGGSPQQPFSSSPTPASGVRKQATEANTGIFALVGLLRSPQAPYIALGAIALLVILLAAVSHFRGRRH